MADDRWLISDVGCWTLDVGRWTLDVNLNRKVDATQNHGGAIGFPPTMVIFFKFQVGRSLTDITLHIRT